jgi:hypothetical protein
VQSKIGLHPNQYFDVRFFPGLANYFKRYIKGFSGIATTLINLTKCSISKRKSTSTSIDWSPECQSAFDTLKTALTSNQLLKIPDFDKPFEIISDASDLALGAILLQDGLPVAFESRVINSAEKLSHN